MAAACGVPAYAVPAEDVNIDAAARATGNDRAEAVMVARALLARSWAAQIVRVRVDRAASHRVAGITLLGVKLKRHVDSKSFYREANELVDLALAADPKLEEVDLRATVPALHKQEVGEMDEPFVQTVFTLTVRRDDPRTREAYFDPLWRAQLDNVR